MKLIFQSEQLLQFNSLVPLEEKNISKYLILFLGQTVWLDTGTLAQEECWVPSAHAQERWEQRWAQGMLNITFLQSSH